MKKKENFNKELCSTLCKMIKEKLDRHTCYHDFVMYDMAIGCGPKVMKKIYFDKCLKDRLDADDVAGGSVLLTF